MGSFTRLLSLGDRARRPDASASVVAGRAPSDRRTDASLLEAVATGEEAAFVEIYRRHHPRVYRFAYHMTGSAATAEDVTHDCFVSLLESPLRFRPGRVELSTYLCAAARNQNLKRLRQSRREVAGPGPDCPSTERSPIERLLEEERARTLRAGILRLPPLHREVVVLFDIEGLDLASVASIVGAEVGAVKVRLHRARGKLRTFLLPDREGERGRKP